MICSDLLKWVVNRQFLSILLIIRIDELNKAKHITTNHNKPKNVIYFKL